MWKFLQKQNTFLVVRITRESVKGDLIHHIS